MKSKYIPFDMRIDVLASLECCALSLRQTQHTGLAWKWVVLSLHSAVQGSIVCRLRSLGNYGELSEKSRKENLVWREKYRRREKPGLAPKLWLDSPEQLFEKLKSTDKDKRYGKPIKVTEKQRSDFQWLTDSRNDFTHFVVDAWLVHPDIIKITMGDLLNLICSIIDDERSFMHMSEHGMKAMDSVINEIREFLLTYPAKVISSS